MKILTKLSITLAVASALVLRAHESLAQGVLTPSSAPSPTMKSLDQIEPRTIVNAVNTPGDSASSFVVSQPGSYYLTNNLTGAGGKNGIKIATNNVTLDLGGFLMQGVPTSLNGIIIGAGTNITVRRGMLNGWASGVFVSSVAATEVMFDRLKATANSNYGILANATCTVRDCSCANNGSYGIYCTFGTVSGCSSDSNLFGIVSVSAAVSGCSAQNNQMDGIYSQQGPVSDCIVNGNSAYGINLLNGIIRDCHAEYNTFDNILVGDGSEVRHCFAISGAGNNANVGIHATAGCKIEDCVVTGDTLGIQTGDGSLITGCNLIYNSSAGISVGNNVLIKDCSACSNFNGIGGGTNCTVIACTASKNGDYGLYFADNCNVRDSTICGNQANGINLGNSGLVSGCIINGNSQTGLQGGIRTTVTGCTVSSNLTFGIFAGGDSVITACHVSANASSATHFAGIYTAGGAGSRVEGNHVRDNFGYGVQASTGDLVIRNFAGGNSTNFLPSVGANFGPIQSPSTMTNAAGNIVF